MNFVAQHKLDAKGKDSEKKGKKIILRLCTTQKPEHCNGNISDSLEMYSFTNIVTFVLLSSIYFTYNFFQIYRF